VFRACGNQNFPTLCGITGVCAMKIEIGRDFFKGPGAVEYH
jgi:hypothetical protein